MTRKTRAATPIDPDLDERLLEALAPVALPRGRQAALARRILARARPPADAPRDFVTVRQHDGAWRPLAPDIHEKLLVSAPGLFARLIRMAPGAVLPAHEHASDEECVVLEGEVWLGEEFCVAGEFHFAPSGRRHEAARTGRGCLLYIRSGAPPGRRGAPPSRP